jgi:hypothetical protein
VQTVFRNGIETETLTAAAKRKKAFCPSGGVWTFYNGRSILCNDR